MGSNIDMDIEALGYGMDFNKNPVATLIATAILIPGVLAVILAVVVGVIVALPFFLAAILAHKCITTVKEWY